MASELYNTIDALSKEKGIDPQIVVSAVEDAIVVATRKYYKTQENLRAELDKETGKINAFAVKSIVESPEQVEDPQLQVTVDDARKVDPGAEIGGELKIPKVTEGILGRIAAQLAKQVIFQKVREAERDTVYNEYIGRVNEIVNATVKRIEGPDVIFDIGKAEAKAPRKEQSRLESFAIGERVRVVISRVEKAAKGQAVIVSRAAPELVQHLFQTEVPEIYDGTVVIRAIAREAGERTKIAVMSSETEKLEEVEQQMSQLTSSTSTPIETLEGLGEGLVEKLKAAGVSSVEALADMTPEQLEAIEGIGPKTVEKISVAVNNYFAGLEGVEAVDLPGNEGEGLAGDAAAEEAPVDVAAEPEDINAQAEATQEEPAVSAGEEQAEEASASEPAEQSPTEENPAEENAA